MRDISGPPCDWCGGRGVKRVTSRLAASWSALEGVAGTVDQRPCDGCGGTGAAS